MCAILLPAHVGLIGSYYWIVAGCLRAWSLRCRSGVDQVTIPATARHAVNVLSIQCLRFFF